MTVLTGLVLVVLGFLLGIFRVCASYSDEVKKQMGSGYYVSEGQAYKVVKVKKDNDND